MRRVCGLSNLRNSESKKSLISAQKSPKIVPKVGLPGSHAVRRNAKMGCASSKAPEQGIDEIKQDASGAYEAAEKGVSMPMYMGTGSADTSLTREARIAQLEVRPRPRRTRAHLHLVCDAIQRGDRRLHLARAGDLRRLRRRQERRRLDGRVRAALRQEDRRRDEEDV